MLLSSLLLRLPTVSNARYLFVLICVGPSSQAAQHFYRSLVNGSTCASPFAGTDVSLLHSLGVRNAAAVVGGGNHNQLAHPTAMITATVATSAGGGSSSSDSHLPTSQCTSVINSFQHLRGLSFTPLAVDPLDSTLISEGYCQQND